MSIRVPFTLTAKTISFFANGRMYNLAASSQDFAALRSALQVPADQDHDIDQLIALCDVRTSIMRQSFGQLMFAEDGETLLWQGKALQSLWVDKIFEYRALGEPFEPIWNALQRLVRNPTPAAIERLPVFLERTALGFMPDGRFLAFKGVDEHFYSLHKSTDGSRFRHLVDDVCEMPRDQVDADPNQTCSTGLHVGAPGYVKRYYSGASHQLVLVAVGPEDVVAVPRDYDGEKMRVCKYTVIAHLDQDYNDELLGSLRGTQSHGYTHVEDMPDAQDETDEQEDAYDSIKVGDVIQHSECGDEEYAVVIQLDTSTDTNFNVQIRTCANDELWISYDSFTRIVPEDELRASMVTCVGALVQIEGHPVLRDGPYTVAEFDADRDTSFLDQESGDDEFFEVEPVGSHGDAKYPVTNGNIMVVNYMGEHLWPRVTDTADLDAHVEENTWPGDADQDTLRPATRDEAMTCVVFKGDLVKLNDQGHPPTGEYPVLDVCPTGVVIETEFDGMPFVAFDRVISVKSRPWMRAEIGGTVTVDRGHPASALQAGTYEVLEIDQRDALILVQGPTCSWWVVFNRVTAAHPKA